MQKKARAAYVAVIIAWLAYAVIVLTTPLSKGSERFGITRTTAFLLNLTIILPYLLTWLAGTYAAATMVSASKTMPEKEERAAYKKIGLGIAVLIGALIVAALVGSLRQRVVGNASATAAVVIVINYLYVFAPLVGFTLIYLGTGHLRSTNDASAKLLKWTVAGGLGLTLFAIAYVWLIFTNPTRQTGLGPETPATYYLQDAAIVVTIIIPFLASCVIGLLAVLRIAAYQRGLSGYVFKKAALHLMGGFLWVIFGSIFLQGLQSIGSGRLMGLGLLPILAIVYVFLAAQAGGYFLLSSGARKLAAIETIMKKYETPAEDAAVAKSV